MSILSKYMEAPTLQFFWAEVSLVNLYMYVCLAEGSDNLGHWHSFSSPSQDLLKQHISRAIYSGSGRGKKILK